jgi:hypothetical protein
MSDTPDLFRTERRLGTPAGRLLGVDNWRLVAGVRKVEFKTLQSYRTFTGLCLAIQDWLGDCDLGAEGPRQRKAAEFGNPAGGLGQLGGD